MATCGEKVGILSVLASEEKCIKVLRGHGGNMPIERFRYECGLSVDGDILVRKALEKKGIVEHRNSRILIRE
jgi:hypothetical protein